MSRIILKISGEALKEDNALVAPSKLNIVYEMVKLLKNLHHEVAIVIGGGNFFRGREHKDMDQVTGDTIGILGSISNALYLKDYLVKQNLRALVVTPFSLSNLISLPSLQELKDEYSKGCVIIFGGGLGQSGLSTDSGTVKAALQLESDLIIKLTNVDGIYSEDPKINPKAAFYPCLSYEEVLQKDLKIMDSYAIKECQKYKIKILVMNFNRYQEIPRYFEGEEIGSVIRGKDE